MKNEPLIFERTFNAPVSKVWKAISDKDEMKEWYFDIKDFKPEVGCEFEFVAGNEGKTFRHLCKVLEVVPNRKLKYSWRYDGFDGNSFVTFELFEEGKQTRLKLTHEGLETFPQETDDFAEKNFVAGWTHLIGTSLKNHLEK